MIAERRCINLYSDMNSWMDLVILVNDEDFDKAKEVAEKAFDDFWNDPKVEEECWAYGDWVEWKLKEANIKYEMYFKRKVVFMKTVVKVYRNKRNNNKYIEVHNDGHYHNSVRQYIEHNQKVAGRKVGIVRNYTGDGSLHRWRKCNLKELLEDYKEV